MSQTTITLLFLLFAVVSFILEKIPLGSLMAIEIVGCVTKSSSEALVMLRVRHAVQKYFN